MDIYDVQSWGTDGLSTSFISKNKAKVPNKVAL